MKGGRYDGASVDEKVVLDEPVELTSRPSTTEYGSVSSLLTTNSNTSPPSEPPSPNYVAVGGEASHAIGDGSYGSEQQGMPGHFTWRGDTHTTPAIRG